MSNAEFDRYIGIDYSGAQTAGSSLPGLRVFMATPADPPREVAPPAGPKKHWTRRAIAEWLRDVLREDRRTIVGIDHGFSFPLRYFEKHGLPRDWGAFLDDFQAHWPTDTDIYVDFVRDGLRGNGAARGGNSRWRRLTEVACGAKSVFHFDCQGSVAKSTHAGLPWLRYLRRELGQRVHVWPFDGWVPPMDRSVIVEVYPALWKTGPVPHGMNPHQRDAYRAAQALRNADDAGDLAVHFQPMLSPAERGTAQVEGWILGVPAAPGPDRAPRSNPRGRGPRAVPADALGRFEGTVLAFGHPGGFVTVDLRAPVHAEMLPFDGAPFGVITACNPDGLEMPERHNRNQDAQLHRRLDELGHAHLRAIGRSPDGSHSEPGFAVLAPREELLALANVFQQLAIFWFDGNAFWIWPVAPEPIRLPRSGTVHTNV